MSSAAHAPPPSRDEPERLTRKRAIAVWTLVVVASILLLLSSLTVWVKRQALDTDAWTNASGQMLANDEIRQQLSIYLVDTLFSSLDATARIEQALPANRAGLAPIITGALQNVAVQAADRILETPKAQALWEEANRRAHTRLDPGPRGQGHGGRSDHPGRRGRPRPEPARPAAERPFRHTGCPGRRQDHDPPLRSTEERAARAQGDQGALGLPARARPLPLRARHLPRPRPRRRFLRATAASFLLVGVLVLVIDRLTQGAVVGSLIKTDAAAPAGNAAWGIGTQLLRSVAYALILYGVAGLIGAWLAGPTRAWLSQLADGWRPCSMTRPGSSTEPWPWCSCS